MEHLSRLRVGRWPGAWQGRRASRAETWRRRSPWGLRGWGGQPRCEGLLLGRLPSTREAPGGGAARGARAGRAVHRLREPDNLAACPLGAGRLRRGRGQGQRRRPLPFPQITAWKLEAPRARCQSRWRRAASASRSAGSPPRRARVRPGPPTPRPRGGGGASARLRPHSPAPAPPTVALRSCARPPRREAPPRDLGEG